MFKISCIARTEQGTFMGLLIYEQRLPKLLAASNISKAQPEIFAHRITCKLGTLLNMDAKVTTLLRKSAHKLYSMYKETQEMLDGLSSAPSVAKVEEIDTRGTDRAVKCIKIEQSPKKRKLIKKKEASKHKPKAEFIVENLDKKSAVKDEDVKQENIKEEESYTSGDEERISDSSDEPKREIKHNTKEEYNSRGGSELRGRSCTFGRVPSVPYNAVEFVDLQ